jgi:hypothetical protein
MADKKFKFMKQQNGNVLLLNSQNDDFVASFIPSMTIKRDKDDLGRFEIMSVLLDYKDIDCSVCSPVIEATTFDAFLIELSEKFFFLNKASSQDNFSRTIKVAPTNLSGEGTIEAQICEYVNSLSLLKKDTDADVWVELDNYLLPIDCVVSEWSEWSGWSECIEGFKTRTRNRTIIAPAQYGGFNTPALLDTETVPCVVDTVNFDADYMVIKYNFSDGMDLDTRTRIVTPNLGQNTQPDYIGWFVKESLQLGNDILLDWGGDNQGTGSESVLVDIKKLSELYPAQDEIVVDIRAFWYSVIGVQPVSINVNMYKGGVMSRDIPTFGFLNTGYTDTLEFNTNGKQITSDGLPVKRSTSGERLATFTYTKSTKTGVFNLFDNTTPEV